MKRLILIVLAALTVAGCGNDNKVTIRGTLSDNTEGLAVLEKSEVDHSTVIDSAVIKRGHLKFALEITGPEFLQVRFENDEFIGLLAMPGEDIDLSFGKSPLAMNYTVSGSPGSEEVRMLDLRLLETNTKLDSIRKIYSDLSAEEIAARGAELEAAYVDIVDAQRNFNIKFVIENISSMAAIKALYQRIDENTYVLYQPRDLQYLKIVSDSLSVKYPVSRHVRALKENVTSELNRMYIDRMASLASQLPEANTTPALPDTKGNMVSVASLRGKYVLVSFWLTTSPECLAELPLLRSLYTEYHAKGLEIFHVSLDRDEEIWKNRVRFEEIPWISVREEDPLNPVYARLMNVQSVPSNLLYDPEGNIINNNLTGRNLQIRLDQVFNKQ
ncbi:MAG: thioredoxin-like domain-containing protein [Bacteroidales bacterium]|nr:thioredoxin-like domain-containing protein [Bacteroidales bacterium]MDT8374347.1 thioredoxin-like domain-containing protein [Bacteroidales bacterium]